VNHWFNILNSKNRLITNTFFTLAAPSEANTNIFEIVKNHLNKVAFYVDHVVRERRDGAGRGSRTPISALARQHNSRYTIPADVLLIVAIQYQIM
jgi:hypothetical protein